MGFIKILSYTKQQRVEIKFMNAYSVEDVYRKSNIQNKINNT